MNPVYIEIDEEGNKFYFKDRSMKKLHREDGPAIEWADGDKEWYNNYGLHREDGPAVEGASGLKLWYLDGIPLSEEEFLKQTNEIKNEQNCYY